MNGLCVACILWSHHLLLTAFETSGRDLAVSECARSSNAPQEYIIELPSRGPDTALIVGMVLAEDFPKDRTSESESDSSFMTLMALPSGFARRGAGVGAVAASSSSSAAEVDARVAATEAFQVEAGAARLDSALCIDEHDGVSLSARQMPLSASTAETDSAWKQTHTFCGLNGPTHLTSMIVD